MKKSIVLLCGLLLVSGVYATGNQMNFGLNFGVMTDDSFSFDPLMWTAGAELDIQFGEFLMFSPEVTLVGNGFKFKEFLLFPAAILNFTPGNFFVGGGLTKGFYLGSGEDFAITDIALKLNAGLISKNIKLTAYLITAFDNLFDGMLVGASLGFRF
jgi:hypothetical protein